MTGKADLLPFEARLAAERVLVTGHTGFTGGWLCAWLSAMGVRPVGIALAPETQPNLFDRGGIGSIAEHRIVDIRDGAAVERAVVEARQLRRRDLTETSAVRSG